MKWTIHNAKYLFRKNIVFLENFASLAVLQFGNLLLPLLIMPFLIAKLGMEEYGLLNYAQAIGFYAQLLTDFGFELSCIKQIANNRGNKENLSRIISAVYVLKTFFALACFVLMGLALLLFPSLRVHPGIYLLALANSVTLSFFPSWFFQGVEKMRFITFLNFTSKVIYTIAIFLFVRSSEDVSKVLSFNLLANITMIILAAYVIRKKYQVHFSKVNSVHLKEQWEEGKNIFFSNVGISLYRSTNTVILGSIAGNIYVGYYSIAEKVVKSFQTIINTASQALFPIISIRVVKGSLKDNIRLLKKVFSYFILFYCCFFLFAFLLSEPILNILFPDLHKNVLIDFKILSVLLIIGCSNYFWGILGLINMGHSKLFLRAVTIAGITSILLSVLTAPLFKDIGVSVSLLVSEVLLAALLFRYFFTLTKVNNLKSA